VVVLLLPPTLPRDGGYGGLHGDPSVGLHSSRFGPEIKDGRSRAKNGAPKKCICR